MFGCRSGRFTTRLSTLTFHAPSVNSRIASNAQKVALDNCDADAATRASPMIVKIGGQTEIKSFSSRIRIIICLETTNDCVDRAAANQPDFSNDAIGGSASNALFCHYSKLSIALAVRML